jgi:alkanesulfonate monooxygenase SsuD/methylene tetrahydromethanopterin reductase-like flavin-dependent oxidoreductase (luciferase family)
MRNGQMSYAASSAVIVISLSGNHLGATPVAGYGENLNPARASCKVGFNDGVGRKTPARCQRSAVPVLEKWEVDVPREAGRIGDGFITVAPDSELLGEYRRHGGQGPGIAAVKVCWDQDENRALKLAHELWPTECLSGQLSQELPMPAHFEAAAEIVTEEMVGDTLACGPDPEKYVKAISAFLDAGFDQVYLNQIGPDQEGFFDFYVRELRRRLDA